jgi:hypothetical protein
MSPQGVNPYRPWEPPPMPTPQPQGIKGWLAIIKRVVNALRKRPRAKP